MIDINKVDKKDLKPGDMFYADWWLKEDGTPVGYVSKQYIRDWLGKRPPIGVVLPNGQTFIVDMAYTLGDNPERNGWMVTGEPPNITVHPSINWVGVYHGWLKDGVLSDDVEGRKFPEVKL
jgi:hypothetical protein